MKNQNASGRERDVVLDALVTLSARMLPPVAAAHLKEQSEAIFAANLPRAETLEKLTALASGLNDSRGRACLRAKWMEYCERMGWDKSERPIVTLQAPATAPRSDSRRRPLDPLKLALSLLSDEALAEFRRVLVSEGKESRDVR